MIDGADLLVVALAPLRQTLGYRLIVDATAGEAEVLAAASGVKLGALLNIDYNWGQVNVFSNTNYGMPKMARAVAESNAMFTDGGSFVPEEITSSDSAAFTWAIAE